MSRSLARQSEVSIRLAIGAGRWTLVRQFMTESFFKALVERARSLPGVESVGLIDRLPPGGISVSAIMVEGANLPRQQRPGAAIRRVDAGYFRTMGIPLRAGRLIEERDEGQRVAVISSLTAQRLWPDENALGKRFRSGPDDSPLVEVVGVVGEVRDTSLAADPPLNIYYPILNSFNVGALAVRTASDTSAVASSMKSFIRELDAELAIPAFRTMEDVLARSVSDRRFQMSDRLESDGFCRACCLE